VPAAHRRGPPARARGRGGAPRPQAREHHGARRRSGEADRLRDRRAPRPGREVHGHGQHPGLARASGPGDDRRQAGRPARRPVLVRDHPLLALVREAALPGDVACRAAAQHPGGDTARSAHGEGVHRRCAGEDHRPLPGERPGPAIPERRRGEARAGAAPARCGDRRPRPRAGRVRPGARGPCGQRARAVGLAQPLRWRGAPRPQADQRGAGRLRAGARARAAECAGEGPGRPDPPARSPVQAGPRHPHRAGLRRGPGRGRSGAVPRYAARVREGGGGAHRSREARPRAERAPKARSGIRHQATHDAPSHRADRDQRPAAPGLRTPGQAPSSAAAEAAGARRRQAAPALRRAGHARRTRSRQREHLRAEAFARAAPRDGAAPLLRRRQPGGDGDEEPGDVQAPLRIAEPRAVRGGQRPS